MYNRYIKTFDEQLLQYDFTKKKIVWLHENTQMFKVFK